MKKKSKVAIGIELIGKESYPSFCLRGYNTLAQEIEHIARRYNIPVVKDSKLVNLLKQIPEDQTIPIDLLPALKVILDELD